MVDAINMFRLNISGFCQTGTVSGDSEFGHVRYRYRNRDSMATFEVDTDSDDSATFSRQTTHKSERNSVNGSNREMIL
ncbi:hypothetical protein D3OALGA1CA_4309 [Olavius algarvensis associated proteobacterium Delta 3]|nr:hypothetical protein D3OALGB2SA_120 [Olavius algarvensis associated proteobacterium Delta 3]CAB5148911.1 hypothetical protein D3OALGA1CA_4309 [Olavius algarvensis associated proteobacterium Delta 3]